MVDLDQPEGFMEILYLFFILLPYSAILAIISLILLIQWALQMRKARIASLGKKAGADPVTTVDRQN